MSSPESSSAPASTSTNSRGSSNPLWSDALKVVEDIRKRLGGAKKNSTDPTELITKLEIAQAELYKIIHPLAEAEKKKIKIPTTIGMFLFLY